MRNVIRIFLRSSSRKISVIALVALGSVVSRADECGAQGLALIAAEFVGAVLGSLYPENPNLRQEIALVSAQGVPEYAETWGKMIDDKIEELSSNLELAQAPLPKCVIDKNFADNTTADAACEAANPGPVKAGQVVFPEPRPLGYQESRASLGCCQSGNKKLVQFVAYRTTFQECRIKQPGINGVDLGRGADARIEGRKYYVAGQCPTRPQTAAAAPDLEKAEAIYWHAVAGEAVPAPDVWPTSEAVTTEGVTTTE